MVAFRFVRCQIFACVALACIAQGGGALAGAAAAVQALSPGEPGAAARPIVIFVARREWHIDIGFAAADLETPLDSLIAQFPEVQYVFFGFGDRHYLMAKRRNVPAMLGALWPGPGLMLITALRADPTLAFGADGLIELRVSAAQAHAVQAFIARTLGPRDEFAPYAMGPYQGSLYFRAIPRYSAFYTCNTWAAEALKAGELPVRSAAILFAGQLWSQVRRLAPATAANAPQALHPVGVPAPIE